MKEQAEQLHEETAAPQVNCKALVAQLNVMQKTLLSLVQAQHKQPRKRLEYDQLRGGMLSEKQKLEVQLAVRSAPLMTDTVRQRRARQHEEFQPC
jgi:hypothetical protein